MLYDRKIKYLDYYEGGSKVSGGGYAKLEMRDDIVRLDITVRGLHPTDSFERDIVLLGAEKEQTLGQIRIQNGNGQFRYSCNTGKGMGNTDITYGELKGIRIPIGGTREIICRWGNESDKKRSIRPEENSHNADPAATEAPKPKEAESKESGGQPSWKIEEGAAQKKQYRDIGEEAVQRERNTDIREEASVGKEESENDISRIGVDGKDISGNGAGQETELRAQWSAALPEEASVAEKKKPSAAENDNSANQSVQEEPVRLMEDKWQQLSAIYPHIQPFQDERDYLSLTPSDFVMFPNRFYRAVNNSFLLHGYYNYHHLILARVEHRGDILYYIGVPGNYFEREKQVAIMFGFESFECEAEPAKTGDFGYYMMRTEL